MTHLFYLFRLLPGPSGTLPNPSAASSATHAGRPIPPRCEASAAALRAASRGASAGRSSGSHRPVRGASDRHSRGERAAGNDSENEKRRIRPEIPRIRPHLKYRFRCKTASRQPRQAERTLRRSPDSGRSARNRQNKRNNAIIKAQSVNTKRNNIFLLKFYDRLRPSDTFFMICT